jgi:DNA-binding LacI/PurR family transcriptional regulator
VAKTIRLVDVAKAAGVSRGTASNVFNHPELVRPAVRERVEAAARDLGYGGPNPVGRLLRAGKVNAIGVVVAGTFAGGFRDAFGQLFMSGIGEVCDRLGAGLALISAHDLHKEAAAWNIQSAVVDGFIVHCHETQMHLLDIARSRGIPFVAVDINPGDSDMAIMIDDRAAARQQAEHLLSLGHRKIGIVSLELAGDERFGFVTPRHRKAARYSVSRNRLAGYADALKGVGIGIDDLPIYEIVLSRESAFDATAAILARAPDTTAILAMSDVAALGAMDYAKSDGLKVPRDLSVIGFDGIPEAKLSNPALTTMAQPISEKGRRAAELVFAGGPAGVVTLDVTFLRGASTAPPRPG